MNMFEAKQESLQETVVRALPENVLGLVKFFGRMSSSKMICKNVLCVSSGIPASEFNFAFALNGSVQSLDANIENAKSFFAAENVPFLWWVIPSLDQQLLEERLSSHSFKKVINAPCMAVELDKISPLELNPGFSFHLVEDDERLKVWAQTAFLGFELKPQVWESFFESVKNFDIVNSHQLFLYLGFLDDLPVSTSLLFLGEGVAGVYWISTIPQARNKGIGYAITYKTIMEARRMGYPIAVLEASEMGLKVYQRLGFKEYFQFSLYGL